jgi:hypothetical protein
MTARSLGRARVAVGALVIAGVLGGLWVAYRPSVPHVVETAPPARVPLLHEAHASVLLRVPQRRRPLRASIVCDGHRRRADGFWRADPSGACDALASTRGALLAGRGCRRLDARRVRLVITGRFGARRFAYRAQRGGCPSDETWLAVNVFATPVLGPERRIVAAGGRG